MSTILMGPGILCKANIGSTPFPGIAIPRTGSSIGGSDVETYLQVTSTNTTSMYGRDAWSTKAAQQFFLTYSGTSATNNKFLAGGAAGATRLNIYSGGRPSISAMSNLNDYASNLLISFPIPVFSTTRSTTGYFIDTGPSFTGINSSTTVDYPGATIYMGICPTFTAAAASGKATWFWFGNYATPTNLSGRSFVTGSVGVTNSNSDLEMSDVNIVSGSLYKSFGFKFYLPAVQQTD
ncbi:MAG: hypothetical protein ACKOXF_10115 [Chitinophagaceae bacterium]